MYKNCELHYITLHYMTRRSCRTSVLLPLLLQVVVEDENECTDKEVNTQSQVDPVQLKNIIENSTDTATILNAVQNCRKVDTLD